MRILKYLGVLLANGLLFSAAWAGDELERGFSNPPDRAKPQTIWHWVNGNITKEGITADLEAMKRIGLGGAFIMQVDDLIPEGPVKFGSPQCRKLIRYALEEAARLGLEIGIHQSPGWCDSGGAWIQPQESMQTVVTREEVVRGPTHFTGVLSKPAVNLGYYRDIALLAFPKPQGEGRQENSLQPKISANGKQLDVACLLDGQLRTGVKLPTPQSAKQKSELLIEFEKPYAARSLYLAGDIPGHQFCEVQTSEDGRTFKTIRTVVTSDFREGIYLALTASGEPVCSRFFRVRLPAKPGQFLAEVNLSQRLSVEQFAIKSAQLRPLGYNAGQEFIVPHDSVAASAGQTVCGEVVSRDKVIDLTGRLGTGDCLKWDAPPGDWILLRIGHTSTGSHSHIGPAGADGLQSDKMSKAASEALWAGMMQPILEEAGPLAGKSLKTAYMDSWENGSQNWTVEFPQEFHKRRGYDLRLFLPVLSNRVVGSPEITERFLWDLRRTIGELFAEYHYGHFTTMAHRGGLKFQCQPYGDGPMDEMLAAGKVDVPMGHFFNFDYGPNGCPSYKVFSSAAHIYGQPIAAAEAYSGRGNWTDYPAQLKPIGDVAFCKGITRFDFYNPAHQPWLNQAPGMTLGHHGMNFNRNSTRWEQSAAWINYLSRCQYLLQEGRFVADACIFTNENYLTGISVPPKPPLPAGYDYDLCDRGTLLERMKFEEGFFTLPSGMRYRYLVLPDSKALTLPVVKKIRDLVAAGGTVIGPKPMYSPTLQDYPACEQEIRNIAAEVWGDCDGKNVTEHPFGKGRVIWGQSYGEIFSAAKLPPDFAAAPTTKTSRINFIHRTSKEADWYFLASADKTPVQKLCSFRVTGKQPEFWYPDTGKIKKVEDYWMENGQTYVPVSFDPCGSVFVMFREKAQDEGHKVELKPLAEPKPLMELSGPWEVSFDSKWFYPDNGMGAKVEFKQLEDWSKRPEEAVKFFSGTAVYEKEFEAPANPASGRMDLDLGQVEVIAEVELNGKNLGVLWKPPFRVDVTEALKPGQKNKLVVKVVNLWPNRLIGDEHLPADCQYAEKGNLVAWPQWLVENKARTSGRRTFTTWRHWKANDPLQPSGLLGPVRLVPATVTTITGK